MMWRNYFSVAIRTLLRQKRYAFINILGLAVGMAACMVTLLYVQNELSYDTYHTNAGQLYRLVDEIHLKDRVIRTAGCPAPWVPALRAEFPEILNHVRMQGTVDRWVIGVGANRFYEYRLIWTDESVFDVFSFPLIQGDPRTALKAPYSIVISEQTARKYFGRDDPMGKPIAVDNTWTFTVTGVMRNIPEQSHFHADMFVSFASLRLIDGEAALNRWLEHGNYYTYLLLQPGTSPMAFEKKALKFLEQRLGAQLRAEGIHLKPTLQPITAIHLHSRLEGELEPNSDIMYVYLFICIAGLILLLAGINFVNLSTACSASRAKEVGLRKALGADRVQLLKQFMGESVLLTLFTFVVAVCLVEFTLPVFREISAKSSLFEGYHLVIVLGLLGIAVCVGLAAGLYPAVVLSAFQPVAVFKGIRRSGSPRALLRKGLVIVQFVVSIALLVSTIVVSNQLTYLGRKNLGFNKDHLVVIPVINQIVRQSYEPFKGAVLRNPAILGIASATGVPGYKIIPVHPFQAGGTTENRSFLMPSLQVDYGYGTVMGLTVVAGRDFSPTFGADFEEAFLVSEATVKRFGWGDPEAAIGKPLEWLAFGGKKGRVIGVVKDFHLRSLHHAIEPVVIQLSRYSESIVVRIPGNDVAEALAFLKQAWVATAPNFPFEYEFLDEYFDQAYKTNQHLGRIVGAGAVLAIGIACLGLFGLAAFMTQQRTKEIGIRKVLGASVSSIMWLLSKDFSTLVLVANLIAWPVAYYAMSQWLQSFAYQIELGPGPFILAALLALVIAVLTVISQTIKTTLTNPVDALRYE